MNLSEEDYIILSQIIMYKNDPEIFERLTSKERVQEIEEFMNKPEVQDLMSKLLVSEDVKNSELVSMLKQRQDFFQKTPQSTDTFKLPFTFKTLVSSIDEFLSVSMSFKVVRFFNNVTLSICGISFFFLSLSSWLFPDDFRIGNISNKDKVLAMKEVSIIIPTWLFITLGGIFSLCLFVLFRYPRK